jgi:hypothetical protein
VLWIAYLGSGLFLFTATIGMLIVDQCNGVDRDENNKVISNTIKPKDMPSQPQKRAQYTFYDTELPCFHPHKSVGKIPFKDEFWVKLLGMFYELQT